jgi:membrane-bound lytic murein transglycosylase B
MISPFPRLRPLMAALLLALGGVPALAAERSERTERIERYGDRPEDRQFIEDMVSRHGFDREALSYIFQRAQYQPSVIKAISPPPSNTPGVRSWLRYRSRFVEPIRIKAGMSFWDRYQPWISAASQQYGVPEEIIVAILGVETIFGRNTGNYQVVSALATLAFDYPRRAELFRGELESLLLLAREQNRDPLNYQGSYAGAMGLPQFLPSSIRNFAVDFDGDGQIDLQNSPQDAIGSVAHYMQVHGWVADLPVAVRARIAPGAQLDELLANDINPTFSAAELAQRGVQAVDGVPVADKQALIELTTPGESPEYWLGSQNFYVITRYNRSSFYAMSVFQLGEAVKAARAARR